MLKRTKLMTSIIVSLIVLAMSVGLLVFFVIQKNNKKDDSSSGVGGTQNIVNGTTFKDYSDTEKEVFSDAVIEGLSLSTRFEAWQEENEWLIDFSTETIDNLSQAFEDAKIDIQIYKAVAQYVLDAAKVASELDFDIKDLIADDQNISLDEVLNVILKVENINIIYRLFTDFYSTGMDNDKIAEVLYYFLQYETSTIDYFKFDFIGGLEALPAENAQQEAQIAAFKILAINAINALVDSSTAVEKEDFIGTVSPLINKIYVMLGMYKDYNLYTMVEIAYKIKNGEVTAEEVAILAGNMREQLLSLVNPETGKAFEITGATYNTIYSFATKVPTFIYLLQQILPGTNLELPLPEMSDSFLEAENFINRLFTGVVNALGKITNEKNLLVLDEEEVVIDRISMAEAICQNLKEIIKDDGVEVNTDTIIIMSKIISGIFEDNAISVEYFDDYMTKNTTIILKTLENTGWGNVVLYYLQILGVAIGEELAQQIAEGTLSVMNAISNYDGLFTNIIRIFNTFSHFDLGTNESKLLDITPSYVLIEDLINNFFTAMFTGKTFTIIELILIVVIVVSLPVIIPLLPVIIVTIGVSTVYMAVAILLLILVKFSGGKITESNPFFWPLKMISLFIKGSVKIVENLYYFVERLFLNEYESPYGGGTTIFDKFYNEWDKII